MSWSEIALYAAIAWCFYSFGWVVGERHGHIEEARDWRSHATNNVKKLSAKCFYRVTKDWPK